jgi:hypothetical protein
MGVRPTLSATPLRLGRRDRPRAGAGARHRRLHALADARAGTCALSESLAKQLGRHVEIGDATVKKGATIERQLVFPQHLKDFVVLGPGDARNGPERAERRPLLAGAFRDPKYYYDARDLRKSVLQLKAAGECDRRRTWQGLRDLAPASAEAHHPLRAGQRPLRAVFGIFALCRARHHGPPHLLPDHGERGGADPRARDPAHRSAPAAPHLRDGDRRVHAALPDGRHPGVFAGCFFARGILALAGLAMGGGAGSIFAGALRSTIRFCWAPARRVACKRADPAFAPRAGASSTRSTRMRRGQIAPTAAERQPQPPLLLAGRSLSAISGTVFFLLPNAVLSAIRR